MLIGVISDTHGLLRDDVRKVLKGVDLIIHAGDIGTVEIIKELKAIAPLVAVRGNCDKGDWTKGLPLTNTFISGKELIYIIHDIAKLDLVPGSAGVSIVIYGHSHSPSYERKGSVIYLNPGSAGPRRFDLPISMSLLKIDEEDVDVEFIKLPDSCELRYDSNENN